MLAWGFETAPSRPAAGQRLFTDMGLVLITKITDRAQYRIRSRLPESTERGIFDDRGHLFQKFDVAFLTSAFTYAGKDPAFSSSLHDMECTFRKTHPGRNP